MAIFYVRKDGADTNDGLADNAAGAVLTLLKANTLATTAGDTVIVHAGTYNEKLWLTHSGSAGGGYITYQAYTGEEVIIDGTGINLNPFSQDEVEHTYANLWSQGLVKIKDINYVIVDGFEIYNADLIGSDCVAIVAFAGVTVDHVTIKNCEIHTAGRSGVATYFATTGAFTNITVDNCEVYDTNYIYNSGEMITLAKVTTGEIKNCTVHDAYWNGTRYQQMIDAKDGSTGILIHDNEIYGNGDIAVYNDGASADAYNNYIHGSGIDVGIQLDNEVEPLTHMDSNLYNNIISGVGTGFKVQIPNLHNDGTDDYTFVFINNTIYDSTGTDVSPICMYGAAANFVSCVIRNNIVVCGESNSVNMLYCQNTPSGITIDHNLFYNAAGITEATYKGTSYITGDPLFVLPPGFASNIPGLIVSALSLQPNFRLQSSSPAIDVGSKTSMPATDYDGNSRSQGLTVDLGAYEYVVVVTAPSSVIDSNRTTADDLCVELSKSIGDYISFSTTTDIAASKLVVSTDLNEYDFASDDYFNNWYVYITDGNNAGVERKIYDYTTSTGTITVYGANLAVDSSSVVCELRRYSRTNILKSINEASKEIFPNLGQYTEDTSIVTGNWLPNGHFDKWSSTSAPDFYTLSSATASEATSAGLHWSGKSSTLVSATSTNGYMYITSNIYPRLLDLMGKSIDFKCQVFPSVSSDTFLIIYTLKADGTAQTFTSTTATYANKWNTVVLEDQLLNDDLVYIEFRFQISTSGSTCYFDNAQLFGSPIEQYICATPLINNKIQGVYIQTVSHTNQTTDPCDNLIPTIWSKIYNWHYWFDGSYDWLEIPSQLDRYKIKLIVLSPLSQLTTGSDTVEVEGHRVNLLLALARYKLFQREKSLPSSQDVTRLDKAISESLAEYNRLLPQHSIPRTLETVRVRY